MKSVLFNLLMQHPKLFTMPEAEFVKVIKAPEQSNVALPEVAAPESRQVRRARERSTAKAKARIMERYKR